MYGQTNGQTDGLTHTRADGLTDRQTNKPTDGRTGGQMEGKESLVQNKKLIIVKVVFPDKRK